MYHMIPCMCHIAVKSLRILSSIPIRSVVKRPQFEKFGREKYQKPLIDEDASIERTSLLYDRWLDLIIREAFHQETNSCTHTQSGLEVG